jgi:hypothetical protein
MPLYNKAGQYVTDRHIKISRTGYLRTAIFHNMKYGEQKYHVLNVNRKHNYRENGHFCSEEKTCNKGTYSDQVKYLWDMIRTYGNDHYNVFNGEI